MDYKIVQGEVSRRVFLRLDRQRLVILRAAPEGMAPSRNTPGEMVRMDSPNVKPFDGELTPEEDAIAMKFILDE